MSQVRLSNLTQIFDETVIVQNISFDVPDGEFWVLVGASGCGKSTILRSIAGLEPIHAGEIYLGDQCVNEIPARQRDVAMVFQNYALYPHMTVAQNLGFGLTMRQASSALVRDRIAEVAQMLNIEHLLNRKPRQLSGGQQQRVALGRAIARQPQVFLLDEPLSNLDAQLRSEMRTELKQLHQRVGITTLYVTHDRTEAMTLADRIVVLDQGQIQQIGTPTEIYDHPANRTVATFIGEPPMNVFPATFDMGKLYIGKQSCDCPFSLQNLLAKQTELGFGSGFELGLRAEAIQLVSPEAGLWRATVEAIEPLGRETFVRVSLPLAGGQSQPLDVLSPLRLSYRSGDVVGITFAESALFVFDRQSGDRLSDPNPEITPSASQYVTVSG